MNPQPLGTTLPPPAHCKPFPVRGAGRKHPKSGLGAGHSLSARAGGCAGPPEGYRGGKDGGARACSWGQPGANPLPTPGFSHPIVFPVISNSILIPMRTCRACLDHYFEFQLYNALNCFIIIQIRLKVLESRDSTFYFCNAGFLINICRIEIKINRHSDCDKFE